MVDAARDDSSRPGRTGSRWRGCLPGCLGCGGLWLLVVVIAWFAFDELVVVVDPPPDPPAVAAARLTDEDALRLVPLIAALPPDRVASIVVGALEGFPFPDLLVGRGFRSWQRRNARKAGFLDPGDEVLAIIDTTPIGTGRRGLVFSGRTLRWSNGRRSRNPGRFVVPYSHLPLMWPADGPQADVALTASTTFAARFPYRRFVAPALRRVRYALICEVASAAGVRFTGPPPTDRSGVGSASAAPWVTSRAASPAQPDGFGAGAVVGSPADAAASAPAPTEPRCRSGTSPSGCWW